MFEKKSKLIIAALGAAFALPMAAQAQTSVTVYGKLYPQIDHYSVTDATRTGRTSTLSSGSNTAASYNDTVMDSPNSRLGFRGTEDLGSGLKAIFQLEMGFGIDTGAGDSTLFSRNTFLGLSDERYGTIKLGNMDTVYKELGDTMPFLGITSGNFMSLSNILSKSTLGGSNSSFHLRRTNSIYYTSPEFAGFQALVDYSLGEAPQPAATAKGSVLSTGIKYEQGPIYAALAYEMHKDMYGFSSSSNAAGSVLNFSTVAGVAGPNAGVTSKDDAMRATFQYRFRPDIRAEVNVARLRYNEDGGTTGHFSSYRQTTWSISGQKDFGPWTLVASGGQATAGTCSLVGGVSCSTSGMGAQMYNLGGAYNFSKRTEVYLVYSLFKNGQSARGGNVIGNNAKQAAGQDSSILALGMSHSF